MENRQWKQIHTQLGCQGCYFCDAAALNRQPCCYYPRQISTSESDGHCEQRRYPRDWPELPDGEGTIPTGGEVEQGDRPDHSTREGLEHA